MSSIQNNVVKMYNLPWVDVKGYELNDLKKTEGRDVNKLKRAIVTKGFNFPFYVWSGNKYVIDGAGRTQALLELEKEGYSIPDLPIVEIQATTLEYAKALVLQASSEHGKITQESFDMFTNGLDLAGLIDSINIPDVKIELSGEDAETLDPEGDPDHTPHLEQEQPFTQMGDIYRIGNHWLMCGDSRNPDSVQMLMGEDKIDFVFIDPSVGVELVEKGSKNAEKENDGGDPVLSAYDAYALCAALGIPTIICWNANYYSDRLELSKGWITWDKKESGKDCELAWSNLDFNPRIFRHSFDKKEKGSHAMQKPVNLMQWLITEVSGNRNQRILDLFGGSGTTMVTCQQLGRECFTMEISPYFCDVMIARMKKLFPKLVILRNGGPIE